MRKLWERIPFHFPFPWTWPYITKGLKDYWGQVQEMEESEPETTS